MSDIRQRVYSGVGGLKKITKNTVAQLKYDGGLWHIHEKDGLAYGLTSKRVSKKTGALSEKLSNFPKLQKTKFKNRKETIWVAEAASEHLKRIERRKRCDYVTGILNSREERIIGSDAYNALSVKPKDAIENDLVLIVHDILYYDGQYVFDLPYEEKYAIIRKNFPSAGKWGEHINSYKSSYCIFAVENIPIEDIELESLPLDEHKGKNTVYSKAIELDFEGVVLKDLKSNESAKRKREGEADVLIIGYIAGKAGVTGKYLGKVGSLLLGVLKDPSLVKNAGKKNRLTADELRKQIEIDNIINVGKTSGFDDSLRDEISNNREYYLGQIIKVAYMQWTGKAMRHPRYESPRDDKQLSRCTLEQFEV